MLSEIFTAKNVVLTASWDCLCVENAFGLKDETSEKEASQFPISDKFLDVESLWKVGFVLTSTIPGIWLLGMKDTTSLLQDAVKKSSTKVEFRVSNVEQLPCPVAHR